MPPFVVWGTSNSIAGNFANHTHVAGAPRDGIATSGDGDIDNNPSGTSSELGYTGVANAVGIYGLRTLTFSDGGTAVWGGGSGGGFVIPTNVTAYNTLLNGTAFTVTAQSGIGSIAYTSLYMPPPPSGNAAPTLGGTPANEMAVEDVATALDLSAYNVADLDGDTITLTLAVSTGTIASVDGNGPTTGVTVANSGSASMTLQGSAANLNSYLNDTSKITYTTVLNSNTTTTLTVTPNDGTVNGTPDTVSISITAINDEPTLTATGLDPNANEQTNTDLFSTVTADTIEAGQTLTALTVTVSNLADGTDEILRIDGSDVALTNGNSIASTTTNGLSVSVSNPGSTATVTISGGTLSEAQMQALVDGMAYRNDSDTPTVGSARVVTITSITDSGSNAGVNDNTSTLNLTSTVTVVPINDDPTGTGLPASVTAVEDTATDVDLSTMTIADVDETGNMSLIITATDGTLAGVTVGGVTPVLSNANQTLTLTGTVAELSTYLATAANIQYTSALNDTGSPADALTVSLNDLDGSGAVSVGTINVNITNVDDEPTLTATGGDPVHHPGTASDLFDTVTADTIEPTQTFASMTLTVSNLADGADETLSIDGDTITLTNGASIASTTTNGLMVDVSVTGSTATVSVTGGTLSEADLATLVDGLSYNNTSATPSLGERVVTITELVDSGSDVAPNENTAALSLTSTIAVVEQGGLIVNTTSDNLNAFDGVTTLREAIDFANADPDQSDITFDPTVFGSNEEILIFIDFIINTDISINGDSDGDGDGDVTINGGASTHMFTVRDLGTEFSLEKIILAEGMSASNGGSINIDEADVTITDSIIRDSDATSGGGAIYQIGGGTLTINGSSIEDTTAGSFGAIFTDDSTLIIDESTISGSETAGVAGGIYSERSNVDITTSTFFDNSGDRGGAIYAAGGTLDATNTTFVNNTADDSVDPDGAAIYLTDFGGALADATLTNVTITGTLGDSTIYTKDSDLDLVGALIVGNNTPITFLQVGGNSSSDAGTLQFGAAADFFAALDPITGGGLLADNGGPVQTVALLEDAGNLALDRALNPGTGTDANGNSRTVDLPGVRNDGMTFVDAGAVELQALGDLTVTLADASIRENDGAGATTGTVTRSGASTSTALVVTLTSSDTTEATVPATVIIGIGDASATFDVAAVDDGVTDGEQTVTITATAAAINPGSDSLVVIENLPPTVTTDPATLALPEDVDVTTRVKVADVIITDDGIGTNNLSIRGADSGSFELDGTELFVRAGANLDFEREAELEVFVDVDDPSIGTARDDTATFTLQLTDVNEAPEVEAKNTVTDLAEDADTSAGIKIADIEISDDALGTNALSLSGADAGLFSIVGEELFLTAGTVLDFETQASLAVTIEIDDTTVGATPDDNVELAIDITDVNEAPTISLTNVIAGIDETSFQGSRVKVADIVITDDALGDEVLTLHGASQYLFQLDGMELFVRGGQALDFETQQPLEVDVAVDDLSIGAGPEDSTTATLNILDVNEVPSLALENVLGGLSEDTDTSARTKIADIVVADDALGTNTLALVGADAGMFEIDGSGLFLSAGAVLDFETDPQLNVTVTLDDPDFAGLEGSEAVALPITDVNEPPMVAVENVLADLPENADTVARIKVADIVITDDGLGTNVLGLAGEDAGLFEIDGSELFLIAGAALDFESNPALDVTVTITNPDPSGEPDDTAEVSVSVTDVNEIPTLALNNVATSLPEDTTARTKVADIIVTDDGLGTNTLALSGADAGLFEIDEAELFLSAGATLDFETDPQLDVTVTLDDAEFAGLEGSEAVALGITDVNEMPIVELLNPIAGLSEDADTTARTKVADIDITDDALGSATLGLTGADAALFEIDGTELFLIAGATLDFESNPNLEVAVTVDDPTLGTDPDGSDSLALAVTDVNEAPSLALANVVASLAEDVDTAARIKIADILITDDGLGANTVSLSGADSGLFEIDGAELFLKEGITLNFESDDQFDVTVTLDDADFVGLEGSESIALAIGDVDELPTVALLNAVSELAEDADTSGRTKVGDIDVSDDALGTANLGLTGVDAGLFEIDGTELFLKAGTTLDFETDASFEVSVTVDDPALGSDPDDSDALTLAITDVNEPPTLALTILVTELPEETDLTARIKVADIAITDDGLGTNTLALIGTDAGLFEIDGAELFLKSATVLDHATNPMLDVTVTVDDAVIGAAAEDSGLVAIAVLDTVHLGTNGNDLLIGTENPDMMMGLGGDDTLVGLQSDDTLDGGAGDADVAVFTAPQENYTISISAGGTTISDRRTDGTGTDVLTDIEILRFSDDPAGTPDTGSEVGLDDLLGALGATEEILESLSVLYIGLFNRAPDALGLLYWAGQSVDGVTYEAITQAFIDSAEATAIYGSAPTSSEVVEGAYNNLFDRSGDTDGAGFWTSLLENGDITPAEFFDLFVAATRKPSSVDDRQTLNDQVDTGLYYSIIKGLSDNVDAKTALDSYDKDDRDASLADTKALIDAFADTANGASPDGDLIVQLTGIIDDPFASL
jgi:hypothetical protein